MQEGWDVPQGEICVLNKLRQATVIWAVGYELNVKELTIYRHTSFYCTCFIVLCRYCFFFINWKFVTTLQVNQASQLASFFQQHLFTLCLCVMFWWFSQYFKLFCYCYTCCGDLWSVIFEVTIIVVLGQHKSCPYKIINLIGKCCVCSDLPCHFSLGPP